LQIKWGNAKSYQLIAALCVISKVAFLDVCRILYGQVQIRATVHGMGLGVQMATSQEYLWVRMDALDPWT
jgi:hypothetical protein